MNNIVKLPLANTQIKDSGYAKHRHSPPNSANYIKNILYNLSGMSIHTILTSFVT